MSFISNIKKIINISGKSESSQIPKTEEEVTLNLLKKKIYNQLFQGRNFILQYAVK